MQKYEIGFVENQEGGEQVAEFVAAYQHNGWLEFLAGLKPLVEHYVARFQEIAEAGPFEDQDVLQSMVTHEESFVRWIEREVAGEEGALDLAISQLKFPLVAP